MKQLKFIAALVLLATVFSVKTEAQAFRNKIVYLTTTDSTVHTIYTVPIAANEAGILTVNFVGYAQDAGGAATSVQVVRYINVAGTITLGTPTAILATASDTPITGSAVGFTVSGNNILITVKSGRPVSVRWQAAISKEQRIKND